MKPRRCFLAALAVTVAVAFQSLPSQADPGIVDTTELRATARAEVADALRVLRPEPVREAGGPNRPTGAGGPLLRAVTSHHAAHGHAQGTAGHLIGDYRSEARLLGIYLTRAAVARYAALLALTGGGLVWHWQLVANCESGDNVNAVSSSGTYRGWLQFDVSSWRANGGQGDPLGQPREVAARIAENYRLRSGTSPWPNCGRFWR